MQLNRKGIPDEQKETKCRELLSSEIYWDGNSPLSISLYVVKTSKGKKNVIFLSTTPPILDITKDDGKSKLGKNQERVFKGVVFCTLSHPTGGFYTS